MKIKISEFKIRCSQIFQIMSEPQSKAAKEAGELSKTAQSYCELWLKEILYNRKKIITSKYFEKGNQCEQAGIDRYNLTFGTNFIKNEIETENDFCKGTPDLFDSNLVIDIKNCYEPFTMPLFDLETCKENYYQIQGYMWLLGLKKGEICRVLEDLPPELIEKELRKLGLEYNEENESYFQYFDVPDELRIKVFEIKRDEEIIKKIESQVIKCRKYINSLIY